MSFGSKLFESLRPSIAQHVVSTEYGVHSDNSSAMIRGRIVSSWSLAKKPKPCPGGQVLMRMDIAHDARETPGVGRQTVSVARSASTDAGGNWNVASLPAG